MGSWWQFEIGQSAAPVWGKNFVPDELMLLFGDDDYQLDSAKIDAVEAADQADEAINADLPADAYRNLIGYSASAGALKRRLQLQGFSLDWVVKLCTAFFDEQELDHSDISDSYPSGQAITSALTTAFGRAAGAGTPPGARTDPRQHFLYERWGELKEAFDDPRFALALALARTRTSTKVKLDLTDLLLGGWITATESPHREARARMAATVAADGPVIVVTEGVSDARCLVRALEVAAPEVAEIFTFLDFGLRPPGGTDKVVSLTKGMAAAGVMNRIIAVFDNDTAGHDAKAQLLKLSMPIQVVAVSLPNVPYAASYPAIGPSGTRLEDVNGRAVSMELMFGEDVLRDAAGRLAPIRWQSYNERAGEWQGRLDTAAKSAAGDRIEAALASGAIEMPLQVKEGCARLAAMLVSAANAPQRIPASEYSALSAMWRNDPFAEISIGQ